MEIEVVRYLDQPVEREEIQRLFGHLGLTIVRTQEPLYKELQLVTFSSEQLIDALVEHPILIERPIVVIGDRAVVARPAELALKLLELS